MNLKTAVNTCIKEKYFCFQGRATRSEFWFFALFQALYLGAVTLIAELIQTIFVYSLEHLALPMLYLFWGLLAINCFAFLIPSLAVTWRRLHDIDRSGGWWVLLNIIPSTLVVITAMVSGWLLFFAAILLLGSNIIYYIWLSRKGTEGENRFGPPVTEDDNQLESPAIIK